MSAAFDPAANAVRHALARHRPFRLGVLLDRRIQEGWVLEALRQCLSHPGTRLAALAVATGPRSGSLARHLHRSFDHIDRHVRCRDERLFELVDLAAELRMPALAFAVENSEHGWRLGENSVPLLRGCAVDVWLCFAATTPEPRAVSLSEIGALGVWGLEIGTSVPAANPWAGAMEVAAGSPVTSVSIVNYADRGQGLLYRAFGATVRNSARLNRLDCLRKGVSFFSRILDRLDAEVTGQAAPARLPDLPARYPALREPTLWALGRLSWRLLSHVAANQLFQLRWRAQWQIAYRFADPADTDPASADPAEAGGTSGTDPLPRLRYLVPPKDRFWADPFAVEYQGRYFIFFEELLYSTGRGRIMAVEVFESAPPGPPMAVLEKDYHLSYPFVFSWDGALYMMPESAESSLLLLYRCERFPEDWRPCRVMLENVSAYDATLWQGEGRWWMFVNIAEPGAPSSDELHLYSSATPLGPWRPHPRNPIISDVRRARCAGPLFMHQGCLHRPSQDCSLAYGHSVWINRIDVLNEHEYRETPVRRISPGWRKDVLRTHTLGGSGRLQVLDYLVNRKQRL
jgi:hypothetical protein